MTLQNIHEPTETISPKAIKVWRINSLIWRGVFLLLLGTALYLTFHFDWNHWIKVGLYVLIGYCTIRLIYKLTIYPLYMQRTWRYSIDEDFIQIKYGFFTKNHFIVPMSRVEYVNTVQGPLLRMYKVATLTIGTLSTPHDIPALTIEEAADLRAKIAHLAKVEIPDEEHTEHVAEEVTIETDEQDA